MTKIDLVTGILGSGKTTFIRKYAEYLSRRGEKTAVLVNDFGAVNADMVMLQDIKSENCTIEMIMGGGDHDCHKRRFKTQLISLGMQNFDRVIVEPSGIFDMDEFFDILYESPIDRWYTAGSIITIAEADMADRMTEQMEYLLASEAADCGKVLVSKLDENADADETAERLLAHINRSLAEIKCDRQLGRGDVLSKKWDSLTDEDFSVLASSGYRNSRYIKKYSFEDIKSTVHYFMNIDIPADKISEVISSIMSDGRCGRIYRIKGSLPCENGWVRVNAVKDKTEISPTDNGQSVLIVIGDDTDKNVIDEHLMNYNRNADYVSI